MAITPLHIQNPSSSAFFEVMQLPGFELSEDVKVADVNQQMMVIMLRQFTDTMRGVSANLQALQQSHVDILTRLTAIESNRMDDRVAAAAIELERLEGRLRNIEDERNQQKGAALLLAWLKDYTPWLIAIAFGMWAYFTKAKPVP